MGEKGERLTGSVIFNDYYFICLTFSVIQYIQIYLTVLLIIKIC